jgi:threonine/homoserine/homoserine lactone efflux protein
VPRATFTNGLRFGLLLQLAVGPVCLYVLRTGSDRGVWDGLSAVAGVTLVDAAYIALAGLGVTAWVADRRMRHVLRYGGAAIITLFGLDVLASALGVPLLPSLVLVGSAMRDSNAFLAALLLTGSNPLTIVFWAGVFSTKVAAEQYERRDLWSFSLGCVAATAAFLTAIAVSGALVGRVAPAVVLRVMNAAVGLALLYLAARLAWGREAHGNASRGVR